MEIFLLIAIVTIAAIAIGRFRQVARDGPLWQRAAEDLGLPVPTYSFGNARMGLDGVVEGIAIKAKPYSDDNGNNTIRYEARFPHSLGLGLKVGKEGSGFQLGKVFPGLGKLLSGGRSEVDVGEVGFDEAVRVRAHDESRAIGYLTPARRVSLERLLDHYPDVEVTDTKITWVHQGTATDLGDLARPARRMVAVALVLTGGDESIERAVEMLEEGYLAAGLQALHEVAGPALPEARLIEAEVLASGAGSMAEVDAVLAELDDVVPDDPEVVALHEMVDLPTPPPPPPPPGLTGPVLLVGGDPVGEDAPSPTAPDRDQLEQLADLFGRSTAEARVVFDERYRGRVATWHGTVRRIARFVNDLDFGEGPGHKLVVAVGAVEVGDYGRVEIDAVVAVGPDVDVAVGTEVVFSATFLKLDGFTRNVFLRDGVLG